MTSIETIATTLVDEVRKSIGLAAPAAEMNEAMAQACVKFFLETGDDLMQPALRLAVQMMNAELNQTAANRYQADLLSAAVGGLRSIEPINIDGLDIGPPENFAPVSMNVEPRTLFVDPAYQRNISEKGLRKIRQMVEAWDWNKFKPPAVTMAEHDGQAVLLVIDGQHTSLAALSHPDIFEIPVMIYEAKETALQAGAFVGMNTGNLLVTPLQIYQAELVAQNEDALTVAQVCARAGINIQRHQKREWEPGDTISINAISKLIDKHTAMKARIILETLVKAELAPITSPQIKAAEFLLSDPDHCREITPESLTEAIKGAWAADNDAAKQLVLSHKWPFWKALAITWFRKTKKTRSAGKPA